MAVHLFKPIEKYGYWRTFSLPVWRLSGWDFKLPWTINSLAMTWPLLEGKGNTKLRPFGGVSFYQLLGPLFRKSVLISVSFMAFFNCCSIAVSFVDSSLYTCVRVWWFNYQWLSKCCNDPSLNFNSTTLVCCFAIHERGNLCSILHIQKLTTFQKTIGEKLFK